MCLFHSYLTDEYSYASTCALPLVRLLETDFTMYRPCALLLGYDY